MTFKRNILIVDDDSTILDFIRDGLIGYRDRFNVHTAKSGSEALQIMDEHQIVLLTTDIRMPGMDGFELIREVRKKNYDTRVIVMTAYGSDEVFEESMEYGVIDYIKKPFTIDRFAEKMFRALEPAKGFKANRMRGFHLTDALQLVHMVSESQTICVRTEFGDECRIYLKDGEVVHAEVEDLRGEEAFYKTITLEGGEIESLPLPEDLPATINRPLAALILEGMRLKDEKEAARKTGVAEQGMVFDFIEHPEGDKNQREPAKPVVHTSTAVTEESPADDPSGKKTKTKEEGLASLSDKEFYRFVDEGFDHFKMGDLLGARKKWEQALELRPDDRGIQFNLKKLAEKENELS
ncbi:MAG: response regulator [Deltaproteobacteria bacterium]|jgi:CheY-like chemotaxis protein